MNNKFAIFTVALLFLSMGVVSATTIINGKITQADNVTAISGADVTVTCNTIERDTTSSIHGNYGVTFLDSECTAGDKATVYAFHSSYGEGEQAGTVDADVIWDWDVAVVNVPLVPEFGLIIGGLTVISALGIFFFVRKQ